MALAGWHIESLPQATAGVTVGNAGRHAVVTGGQNITFLDEQGSYLTPQAGGAGSHESCDIHKILVPGWPVHKLPLYISRSK